MLEAWPQSVAPHQAAPVVVSPTVTHPLNGAEMESHLRHDLAFTKTKNMSR